MYAHCERPIERLGWDDVCELWDDGVLTAEEVQRIATLFFDGAELRAVLKVIESVEDDSRSLVAVNTDTGDRPRRSTEREKKAA
jgi:hypothetical protein